MDFRGGLLINPGACLCNIEWHKRVGSRADHQKLLFSEIGTPIDVVVLLEGSSRIYPRNIFAYWECTHPCCLLKSILGHPARKHWHCTSFPTVRWDSQGWGTPSTNNPYLETWAPHLTESGLVTLKHLGHASLVPREHAVIRGSTYSSAFSVC